MKNNEGQNKAERLNLIQEKVEELTSSLKELRLEAKGIIDELNEERNSGSVPVVAQAVPSKPKKAKKVRSFKKQISLFAALSGKFQEGDIVVVTNHYKNKHGDLFGREGKAIKVGRSFIFFEVPGIEGTHQRSEENLDLVRREE